MEQPEAPQKKQTLRYLLGIGGICLALYTVITSGAPGYTVPLAEERLTQLSDYFSKFAKVSGQDARMHYNSLSLEGYGQNKHAIIARWSLDFLRQSWISTEKLTLSSENVHLVPNHLLPDSISLQFGQVINIISGSELRYTITPSGSIYLLSFSSGDKNNYDITQMFGMPKDGKLTVQDRNNEISADFTNQLQGEIELASPYTSMTTSIITGPFTLNQPHLLWNVANGILKFNIIKRTPRVVETKGTLTLDDMRASKEGEQSEPAHFNAAWMFKELLSMSGVVESSELEIERAILTNDQIKIATSGNLFFSVEDKQPYGELMLEINDIKQLAASKWVKPEKTAQLNQMLEEIIGQKLESRTQEIITIQREKAGEWKCGKITCQALIEQGMLETFIFNRSSEKK